MTPTNSPCDIVKVRYTYIKSSIDNVVYLRVCTSAAEVGWEMHFLISNTHNYSKCTWSGYKINHSDIIHKTVCDTPLMPETSVFGTS